MTEPSWGDVEVLLASLPPEPSYVELQRAGRRLVALGEAGVESPSGRTVRVALAGSHTLEPLVFALAVECALAGVAPRIQVDGFDQFTPHMLDPGSALYAFEPDLVFLSWDLAGLTPSTGETTVVDAARRVDDIASAFTASTTALLVAHNFVVPDHAPFGIAPPDRSHERALNDWLAERFADDMRVHVLDFEALAAFHGKSRITSPKLRALAGIETSESFLRVLAKKYMSYVKAAKGLTRKCLVVDLDDTLWGGVIGEDGLDGIALARTGPGSEYHELQRAILALHGRGVILAVNSNNNPDDALLVLREHPDMVLREEHFSAMQLNWDEKASKLRAIAADLNIGLDAIAFLDTSPIEREWVRQALPEVLVIDLPNDPSLYAETIEQLNDFESLAVTEEDRRRTDLYAAEHSRRTFQERSQSFESFLRGLAMVLKIGRLSPADAARVGQLTRRTNQFNVATKRYSDAEISDLADRDDACIYTLRLSDIFGDAGLVGVAILRHGNSGWEIDTYLMSCRVLGRTVERAFLTAVLADVKGDGASHVRGVFLPTPKNGPAAGFYEDFGFNATGGEAGSAVTYELDLEAWSPAQPDWFQIEWTAVPTNEAVSVADR